jgi:hypothetical protein
MELTPLVDARSPEPICHLCGQTADRHLAGLHEFAASPTHPRPRPAPLDPGPSPHPPASPSDPPDQSPPDRTPSAPVPSPPSISTPSV